MSASHIMLDPLSTDHLHADLKQRSIRGGLWTLASQGVQFIMQSISTVVLAHLLVPADFGLVAMITVITGLGQAFAELGLSEATVQHPDINHKQVSTLFWINLGIGCLLTVITVALAPVLAWFYRDPRLENITFISSITFLIGGLRVQHNALLQRQMRFRLMAIRDVISYMVAVPIAIFSAWKGAGYWAIVIMPLILNGIQMVLSWGMARWVPGLPDRKAKIRSLVAFGGNVAASYLVLNTTHSVDSVLIGWYWGAGPLGLYSRALNLLLLPVRQITGPARNVAVPAFSRSQDDPERLAQFYLGTANLIMWIAAPVFGFLFVAAAPIIVLTLGGKWYEAAPIFKILSISAIGQLIYESLVWLLISRGESKRLLKLAGAVCPIMIASYALALPFGVKEVAFAGASVTLLIFPWVLSYSFRGTSITLQRLGWKLLYPVITCLAGIAAGELALSRIASSSAVIQLLLIALTFTGGCLSMLLLRPVREETRALLMLLSHRAMPVQASLIENLD